MLVGRLRGLRDGRASPRLPDTSPSDLHPLSPFGRKLSRHAVGWRSPSQKIRIGAIERAYLIVSRDPGQVAEKAALRVRRGLVRWPGVRRLYPTSADSLSGPLRSVHKGIPVRTSETLIADQRLSPQCRNAKLFQRNSGGATTSVSAGFNLLRMTRTARMFSLRTALASTSIEALAITDGTTSDPIIAATHPGWNARMKTWSEISHKPKNQRLMKTILDGAQKQHSLNDRRDVRHGGVGGP